MAIRHDPGDAYKPLSKYLRPTDYFGLRQTMPLVGSRSGPRLFWRLQRCAYR